MFHIGQEIECIDASPGYATGDPVRLNRGGKYIVDSLESLFVVAVRVVGDRNWYSPKRFRPILKRATDISCFTALLNPSPQKVRESIGYDLGFTAEEIGLS